MSTDYCHPTAPHKKLRMPNWYVSSLMMDRALDAVARKVKTLDRKHDIPYVAGYSKDGKTIYIDRHLPSEMQYKGRTINTDRFLLLHEEVEKTLIDQLDLHYLHAHQIATRAEEAAVRAAGISWRDYDRFMQTYVKKMGDERLTKIPADLDLKPYRDEHDKELLERMATSVAKGEHPPGVDKAKLHAKIKDHIKDLVAHAHPHMPQGSGKKSVLGDRVSAAGMKPAAKKPSAKKPAVKKPAAKGAAAKRK